MGSQLGIYLDGAPIFDHVTFDSCILNERGYTNDRRDASYCLRLALMSEIR